MQEPDEDEVMKIMMENGFGGQTGKKAAAPTSEDSIMA